MAQQSLHNFYLNKYNASLSVKWVINPKEDEDEVTMIEPPPQEEPQLMLPAPAQQP